MDMITFHGLHNSPTPGLVPMDFIAACVL